MKLSWKIFFSTLVLISVTFSTGCYLLISISFENTLQREIASAKEENTLLRFSFENALETLGMDTYSYSPMREFARTMEKNLGSGNGRIRLSDSAKNTIIAGEGLDVDKALLDEISEEKRVFSVVKVKEKDYVQVASQIQKGTQTLYLENFHDITSIFAERQAQYQMYIHLMWILLLLNGFFSFGIAVWLTRPIKMLTQMSRRIAAGEFQERVQIQSHDEIGELAAEFNLMANHLEEKIAALEDAMKRQELFIGSFAHELKTPLTAIIGYADMLRLKALPPEQRLLAADYIFKEGQRLESLSLKLLDLIVLKKQNMEWQSVSVQRLIREIEKYMLSVLQGTNIQFRYETEEAVIYADPDLLKALLINLIDNARKAVEQDGMIVLCGKKTVSGYQITIEDNGQGIPAEELSMITEAFYMVDKSRARIQGGAGLGLAICAEIIRLHHGTIEFKSELGIGTTVTVLLKRRQG